MKMPICAFFSIVALSACGTPSANPAAPSAVAPNDASRSLVATPAHVAFRVASLIPLPQLVTLTDAAGVGSRFAVDVDDPTQVGVAAVRPVNATRARTFFYAISSGEGGDGGTTTVTIALPSGAAVRVPVTQEPCGRPDNIVHADLIYPPKHRTKVAPSIGALYFAVYSEVAPSAAYPAHLHLIAGKHATLEGGTLAQATPPPGSVVPMPPPGPFVTTYMKGDVATLPSTVQIGTQVYDDTCQPPILAGTFSTK
jgi:hypothetical protein